MGKPPASWYCTRVAVGTVLGMALGASWTARKSGRGSGSDGTTEREFGGVELVQYSERAREERAAYSATSPGNVVVPGTGVAQHPSVSDSSSLLGTGS